jgi:hypothetical protein
LDFRNRTNNTDKDESHLISSGFEIQVIFIHLGRFVLIHTRIWWASGLHGTQSKLKWVHERHVKPPLSTFACRLSVVTWMTNTSPSAMKRHKATEHADSKLPPSHSS